MQTISLKIDDRTSKELEKFMHKHRYATKTEFIREAIRKQMQELEMQEDLEHMRRTRGIWKKKTTDAQLHRVREKVAQEILKEFGIDK